MLIVIILIVCQEEFCSNPTTNMHSFSICAREHVCMRKYNYGLDIDYNQFMEYSVLNYANQRAQILSFRLETPENSLMVFAETFVLFRTVEGNLSICRQSL